MARTRPQSPARCTLACVVLLFALAGGLLAQHSMSSASYSSECTIVPVAIDTIQSPTYETLIEVGSITSDEMTSPSYSMVLDVLCEQGGCQVAVCGDCDGDGVLTILDALLAGQHAVMLVILQGQQFDSCDVDGSGFVDILDALVVAQTAAGLPTTLMCC